MLHSSGHQKFAIYALLPFGLNDFLSSLIRIRYCNDLFADDIFRSLIYAFCKLVAVLKFHARRWWLTDSVCRTIKSEKFYPHSSNQCRKWRCRRMAENYHKRISVKLIGPINNSPDSHWTNFSVHMQCSNMPYRDQFAFVFCYPRRLHIFTRETSVKFSSILQQQHLAKKIVKELCSWSGASKKY